jgi:hypothetical protein
MPSLFWVPFPGFWQVETNGVPADQLAAWAHKMALDCETSAQQVKGRGSKAAKAMYRHRAGSLRRLAADPAKCHAIAQSGRGSF